MVAAQSFHRGVSWHSDRYVQSAALQVGERVLDCLSQCEGQDESKIAGNRSLPPGRVSTATSMTFQADEGVHS